jgi:hypothetical protein
VLRRQFLVAALAGVIAAGSTVGAYAAISRSEQPVRSDVDNTAVAPGSTSPQEGPQTVTPRPGMINVRPTAWQEAEALDDRTVRVLFSSGVEPCYVLDHVTVDYGADEVAITLYQGSDPHYADAVCIQIAINKVTEVTLDEPLAGRAIVDGSRPR